ncbi:hypothetical protein DdX_06096 [Ditylenchus destructor]|uniref:MULE transposase domain-containing protein n=1 Tax=Ditylenchus destructor TaxID=166010 RepID=A0AAD4NBN6_9BILA|nr:hypothetical protein DdX_06096 [Ditylenchus destructor]
MLGLRSLRSLRPRRENQYWVGFVKISAAFGGLDKPKQSAAQRTHPLGGALFWFIEAAEGGRDLHELDDSTQCYTWSKSGRIDRRKDKTEIQTFVCTTCRALNAKANQGLVKKTNIDLPTKKLIKFEDGHAEWVSKEYHDEHVRGCVAQDSDKVLAEGLVQDQINTISTGLLKCTASAAVKGVENKLTQLYANKGQDRFNAIRDHVKTSQETLQKRFQRANNRRYKRMSDYHTIMKDQFEKYRFTLRSEKIVDPKNEFYQEKLLICQNEKMMLFGSKAQLDMLAKSEYLVCDGTFATAPKKTMQTYRVFAQIENKETGSFCFAPAITCLLKNKTQATYKAMWIKIREELQSLGWALNVKFTFFDQEPASWKTFRSVFQKPVKLCSFHFKQAVHRKHNDQVFTLVRMVGAIIHVPADRCEEAVDCVQNWVDKLFGQDEAELTLKLNQWLQYIRDYWLKLDRSFFSLFDLPAEAPKTTNIAESYHAHLVHHFRSKKVTLGTWITDFRDLHNMEVLICEDVIRGKEIPVHLNEEYRRNAAEIEEAKRQLQDDDLEGIFDASHNSSMESVNTAKLGQYLVVVGAHMGNSENNKRRIAETGTEDPEISDEEIVEEENDDEEYDENDEPWDENYRGMESSIELEESESDDDDSQ